LFKKIFTAHLQMIWGVAGLRPNFFSSGLFFGWTGPGVLTGSGSSARAIKVLGISRFFTAAIFLVHVAAEWQSAGWQISLQN
jgi:hypothetical protein